MRLALPTKALALVPQELLERAPLVVSVLLGLLIFADTVSFARAWRAAAAPLAPSPLVLPTRAPVLDVEAVVAASLFGGAPVTEDVAVASTAQLDLLGTIATEQGDQGFAVLAERGGPAHVYFVGAQVVGGATLLKVYPDRVVLQRGTQAEVLMLPRHGAAQPGVRRRATLSPPIPIEAPEKIKPPPMPTSGAVMQTLHLKPVAGAGHHKGLLVVGFPDKTDALQALGLNRGDLIVAVDGNPADMTGKVMRPLQAGDVLTLSIERAGSMVQVVIDPSKAEAAADLYRNAPPP